MLLSLLATTAATNRQRLYLATGRTFSNTMASGNNPSSLKYLLVLDFEATCGDNIKSMEIIEFPTLLYNLNEG
jgi:hypothetical protein